jgi:hypothetical protein
MWGNSLRSWRVWLVATVLFSLVSVQRESGASPVRTTGAVIVVAVDSATGNPLLNALVVVRPPGWYWSEKHQEPEWWDYTDSHGAAKLNEIPAGVYIVSACEASHETEDVEWNSLPGTRDSLVVRLRYVGLPRDGRRCDIRLGGRSALSITVVDSSAEGVSAIRYANVIVDGKPFVANKEGVVVVDVVPGVHTVQVRDMGWEIQQVDTVNVWVGQVREKRHVMTGERPIGKE